MSVREAGTHARPLEVVRQLYGSWNAGSVARAAALLAPDVRWENFGEAQPVAGLEGLQATLAGPVSGGTMMLSPVLVDVLVGVGDHVLSCARRSDPGGERERFEVWTVAGGRVTHYRGYRIEEGLAVITESTGSGRPATLCRDLAAFNRGRASGWPASVAGSGPGARLDDIELLADSPGLLVVSAVRGSAGGAPLHLVLAFAGDVVQRVSGYPSAAAALTAASAGV